MADDPEQTPMARWRATLSALPWRAVALSAFALGIALLVVALVVARS